MRKKERSTEMAREKERQRQTRRESDVFQIINSSILNFIFVVRSLFFFKKK